MKVRSKGTTTITIILSRQMSDMGFNVSVHMVWLWRYSLYHIWLHTPFWAIASATQKNHENRRRTVWMDLKTSHLHRQESTLFASVCS